MQQMVLGSFEGQWLEVRDEMQARLLTDPTARALLTPFLGAERSAAQAAREAGCSLQRMAYRITQFQRAGVLRETRQERRSGRPVRYYQAVADGFHVPFEVTPFEDVEAMMARQYAPFDRLRNRASARRARQRAAVGRLIYRDAVSGEVHSESADGGAPTEDRARQGSPGSDVVFTVRLSDEMARSFAEELGDLYRRMEAARPPDGQGGLHLVSLGLLPLTREDGEPDGR